jgi:lipopolysaccharide export system permease protein
MKIQLSLSKKYTFPVPATLYKMLFKSFLSWFAVAVSLFVIILLIIDLFVKLNDYINASTPILQILTVTFLYVPKSISLILPVPIMFGITMSLGSYYQNNELVAIYTSGLSLFRLAIPLIIFNLLLSCCMIFIDANFVIPTERYRKTLYEKVVKKNNAGKFDNENITIRGEDNFFWNVGKYTSSQSTIQNVILFKINSDYHITYRIDAEKAKYTNEGWIFYSGVLREWDETGSLKQELKFQRKIVDLKDKPNIFKKFQDDIENMTISEAKERIELLKKLNIEHNKELTNYYKKFSFPFTLLFAALFAIGVATVSRTNVLILSLFFSVGLLVLFYVMQMILDVMASTGKIPPIIGAWFSLLIFFPISIYLIRRAKT